MRHVCCEAKGKHDAAFFSGMAATRPISAGVHYVVMLLKALLLSPLSAECEHLQHLATKQERFLPVLFILCMLQPYKHPWL